METVFLIIVMIMYTLYLNIHSGVGQINGGGGGGGGGLECVLGVDRRQWGKRGGGGGV